MFDLFRLNRRQRVIAFPFVLALGALVAGFAVNGLSKQSADAAIGLPSPRNRIPEVLGLERANSGPCAGLFRIVGSNLCTHGPDPRMHFGAEHPPPVEPVLPADATPSVQCIGNGSSGNRVQVLYTRVSGAPDRYHTFLSSFRFWITETDEIFDHSATETGGVRHIRFVHDANCVVPVANVVVSAAASNNMATMRSELAAQGFNSSNRKYVIFHDAEVLCGIGTIARDDSPLSTNANNFGPSYARVDTDCWRGEVVAHELGHNLGAVQFSAPNASGGWFHCVDEYDQMCYSDFPNYPPLHYTCTDPAHEYRLDCNHDDYFHTNPSPGSYLATHWNVANSGFLSSTEVNGGSISGTVRNAGGTPQSRVAVTLDNMLPPVFTDGSGQFMFTGVSHGTHSLRASSLCTTGTTSTVKVDGSESLSLTVAKRPGTPGCSNVTPAYVAGTTETALSGDDASIEIALPFSFDHFGDTNYTKAFVSTNGYLSFLNATSASTNTAIPDSGAAPAAAIYALWDNLVMDGPGRLRTKTEGAAPRRRFIIEWSNVRFFDDPHQRFSFEVVLIERSSNSHDAIRLQYKNNIVSNVQTSFTASIGIEDAAGTAGTQSFFGFPIISNGLAAVYPK
jgi:hypothetical protein